MHQLANDIFGLRFISTFLVIDSSKRFFREIKWSRQARMRNIWHSTFKNIFVNNVGTSSLNMLFEST